MISFFAQTKCNYSLNFEMHFNTCRGPGVKSAKIQNFKIRSVDGFGLDERARLLTGFYEVYTGFGEKS